MKARNRPPKVARDQTPTQFGAILARLLRRCSGVKAAVLIDPEGEAVDYAGDLPDYFTKLVSAHFRIVIDDVAGRFASAHLGTPYQLTVRADPWTFTARRLPDGYALVIILQRRAFTLSTRALAVCDEELAREAGWAVEPPVFGSWIALDVEPSRIDRRRPGRVRAGGRWYAVDILGSVVGLRHECGYRCRLSSGVEVTLVREPSGQWFADERLPVERRRDPARADRAAARRRPTQQSPMISTPPENPSKKK